MSYTPNFYVLTNTAFFKPYSFPSEILISIINILQQTTLTWIRYSNLTFSPLVDF